MRNLKVLIFSVVLIFTFILRAHNYEKVPTPAHLDEQLYALSGINLIEKGIPISWSTLDYPKNAEVFKGKISYNGGEPSASVTLYKPWLDEPPLFSLLVGEFAHLSKANPISFIPSSYIREPVVIISALTSILVFLIAFEVGNFWIAALSMLIYGTEPIFVFASRTAMPETLIAFFFCLVFYLLLKYIKSGKFVYLSPIPILAGFAGLSKPTGFFLVLPAVYAVFYVVSKSKKIDWKSIWLKALYLILLTLPFVGVFIWYGNHFSPEIFQRVIAIQGFRPAGFNNLSLFITTPSYEMSVLRSSWYVFCLISSIFFVLKPKEGEAKFIPLAFVFWLIVVALSSGESDLLSWYRFPAFPFMAIMGAWGIEYIFENVNFLTSFIAIGLLLGSRSLLVNAFHPDISTASFRIIFLVLLVPSLALSLFKKDWLVTISKTVLVVTVVVGMWWNVKYVYNAYELACQSKSCPLVPTTMLSTIRIPFFWRLLVIK